MGNRGILHNEKNEIVRPWAHKAWVTCLLEFKGYKRSKPFSTGNYSELFFLDEATGLAAGHRPCGHCQRARHLEFKDAWLRANLPEGASRSALITELDRQLHAERAIPGGQKQTFEAKLSELPLGTFFDMDSVAYLVTARGYLPWSFEGYGDPTAITTDTKVNVLTPRSIIRAISEGYDPKVHSSAKR